MQCSGVDDLDCDRTGYLEPCNENVSTVCSSVFLMVMSCMTKTWGR